MITKSDLEAAELQAAELENEERINELMRTAGLPSLHITREDRLRGAIVSAMADIERGHTCAALTTLNEALKMLAGTPPH